MILEKVYLETVNVRDPVGYCADSRKFVLAHLRRTLAGRCRGGAFILEIREVLAQSDLVMQETNLSAEGVVHVRFRALVSVLGAWEVLTGVRVVSRGQLIVGQSEAEGKAAVVLLPTPEAETVRVGQTVAVRVTAARYDPDQPQASVIGVLLTCDRRAPAYALAEDLGAEDARELRPLAAAVRALLEARAALVAARRDDVFFFEALLYSYAVPGGAAAALPGGAAAALPAWEGPPGVPLPPGAAPVDLLALVEGGGGAAAGVWARDLALFRSSPLAARASAGAVPPGWEAPVEARPRTAFAEMLGTVLSFLKAVNEMAAHYNTPELIESHRNVWLAMRAAQLPPP